MANIELLGNTYNDVPAVELPKSGGGTVMFYENPGSKIELLWTNANPTASFAEQTVRFNDTYDAYIITSRSSTSYNVSASSVIKNSESAGLSVQHYNAGENYRSAWPSASSIGFASGHPDNTRVIPIYIWGIKY